MHLLDSISQRQIGQAFGSPSSVRIPDHGTTHNLVGKEWCSPRSIKQEFAVLRRAKRA
jgi:hypothetical protein